MPRNVSAAPKTSRFVLLASICVVVSALYFAQEVLIPLALAMLLSFLLAPLVHRLEQWKLGRVPSVLIVVIVLFAAIGVLGYVVAMQVYDLADNVEKYEANIVSKIEAVHPKGGGIIERLQKTATEVEKKIDQPEKAAATQTSQPADKVANVVASEMAARNGQPRVVSEKSASTGGVATTQWTRENPLPVGLVEPKQSPMTTLGHYLGLALSPLGTAGIVIVFVIFMLLSREDLRNRLIRLVTTGSAQLTLATQALDDAASRISRYLLAQAIVNGTYGIGIALGIWIIGLTIGRHDPSGTQTFPNVILWGLLCAILRFIPYIGPWIAASFPVIIALAVYKGFGVFGAIVGLFVLIELLSNNFMEPWLYGSSTGMSTVAILVSAVFWTWLWGPIGLLLSTPLTVVLVVLGKYVPQLQFLDVLLGDEPVLDPPTRVYQRLLALDSEEAAEVLEEYRRNMPLERLYDTVLLPALALAEQDRHRGLLDDRRQVFIRRSMRELVEELGDAERMDRASKAASETEQFARGEIRSDQLTGGNGHRSSPAQSPDAPREKVPERAFVPKNCTINIVCLPAHDEADEIVNLMLGQLLEFRGYCTYSVSNSALASEMVEKIEAHHADVVVVSALPPDAVAHARYLCKRVHARFADARMAVGIWTYRGDVERARERMTCVASVQLVTTLGDMQTQIDQLAHPAIVRATPAKSEI